MRNEKKEIMLDEGKKGRLGTFAECDLDPKFKILKDL